MALANDLERAAAAASEHGEVVAVLPAEPASGRRFYLIALGGDDARRWLVLDAGYRPVADRDAIRDTASIVALCELAGDLAGGGHLEELRARLADVRMTEQPAGIEAVEETALALERAIGAPPVIASATYLDGVGSATKRLEDALGDHTSAFANALAAASGTVEAFVAEVEERQALPLR